MKILNYISVAALSVLLLISCKGEDCPVPFCTMTFNIDTQASIETPTLFPITNMAAFLRNETTGKVIGPIEFNMNDAIVTNTGSTNNITSFNCKIDHAMPYGQYTMWIWANVESDEAYSFDRFSINVRNNYIGADYLLGVASTIDINSRKGSQDITMQRLTASINTSVMDGVAGVNLYVENVYKSVNAKGEYSNATTLEFEQGTDPGLFPNVPPARFYSFPTVTDQTSTVHLEYIQGGVADSEPSFSGQILESGSKYTYLFGKTVQ